MKITALETIRLDEFPNVLWVRVHTDEGLVGLGEMHLGTGPWLERSWTAGPTAARVHSHAHPQQPRPGVATCRQSKVSAFWT